MPPKRARVCRVGFVGVMGGRERGIGGRRDPFFLFMILDAASMSLDSETKKGSRKVWAEVWGGLGGRQTRVKGGTGGGCTHSEPYPRFFTFAGKKQGGTDCPRVAT